MYQRKEGETEDVDVGTLSASQYFGTFLFFLSRLFFILEPGVSLVEFHFEISPGIVPHGRI